MPVWYRNAFDELDLRLEEYDFDNAGPGEFDTSVRGHSLVESSARGWSDVTICGEVELPDDIQEVFPPDEHSDPPAKLTVAIDCPDTHHRYGLDVEIPTIEGGSYEFEETISRDYAYGEVFFRPLLVRTPTEVDETPSGYVQHPYTRVADGPPTVVVFDDVETQDASLMDVRFESFEKNDVYPDHNLYHLDRSDASSPSVVVNEDYELVARALDNEANQGWAADFRDAISPWIAKDVTVELVLWALLNADESGSYEADWQEELVDEYAPKILQPFNADEPAALREKLTGDGNEAHYVINTVEKTVQDEIRVTKPLEDFVQSQATPYFLENQ